MSGRRRRGRRPPWDQRDGSGSPGQPRFGSDGVPRSSAPPRGFGGYTGPPSGYAGSPAGGGRWPGGGGAAGRRPDAGRFGRGRGSNGAGGTSAPPTRRWSPGYGDPRGAGQYGQNRRWSRGARPSPPPTGRPEPPPSVPRGGDVDPFELFCAYHLGITADGGYHIQNIHEVARRFGTNAAALRQTLAAYGMDAEDLVHSGFDLASAQIDIMVAPEGISRRELARPLYDEFKSAPRKVRDWAKEMEEADREIERTIGREKWSPTPRVRS